MRFRRKLLLTLGITTFVTAGLCLGVMERVAHDQMFDAYRAKLLSIAATTAAHISEEHLTDAAALRTQLRKTRDANRRDDTRVARLSVIAPSTHEDGVWVFVADPEDDPKLSVMPGETWRSSQGFDPSRPSAETEFVKDEFGTFLHAFAPVRDRAGKTVAVVVAAA